jgi:uncharacterized membrane protein
MRAFTIDFFAPSWDSEHNNGTYMQYFIHHNNQQIGPFTEAEVKAKLAAGEISATDHVWWEGQQGWTPLGQTALGGMTAPAVPVAPVAPAITVAPVSGEPTSKLAIWSLVLGCLSLVCGIFASIPAIILGHMGLSETQKNPAIKGRGLAMAGLIIGYVMLVLQVVAVFVFIALSYKVKETFNTINAQLKDAEQTNSATSTDQSTNSAPANSTTPDSSTNSATTNAAPATQ